MEQQNASDPALPLRGRPFQRLMILHLNLPLLSTGKDLGESASLEELSEQILYECKFKDTPPTSSSSPPISNHFYEQQEAVQFAGLCSALYNLPDTLRSYSNHSQESTTCIHFDPTLEVQLDNSTLVFVPLESSLELSHSTSTEEQRKYPNIVAVAQISRASGGGNPLAVRRCIERWHKLFCLVRGGGIHLRLSEKSCKGANTNKESNQRCLYPGMDQVFVGQKTLRRLRETMMRLPEPDADLEQEHKTLTNQLKQFRKALPISYLREDLRYHYDVFIGDYNLVAAREGGAGRCLVEMVPPPSAVADASHAQRWAPRRPPPHVTYHLGQVIQALLAEDSSMLLAVSSFFHGGLLYHHSNNMDSSLSQTKESEQHSASLLLWYLAFYSYKMKNRQQSQQAFESSYNAEISDRNPGVNQQTGKFLETPPLAMLSASEHRTMTLRGPDGEAVWAPLVHCNSFLGGSRVSAGHNKEKPSHVYVVLFEWEQFAFLLYIRLADQSGSSRSRENLSASHDGKEDDEISTLLGKISSAIAEILNVVVSSTGALGRKLSQTQHDFSDAPGHVVFVDRAANKMMLFPHSPRNTPSVSSSPKSKRFIDGFFRPSTAEQNGKMIPVHDACNWAEEGLDCRHWLASRLSSDKMIAFDDVMNEVHCWKAGQQEGGAGNHEILTTVNDSWVYAFADQDGRELYCVMDSRDIVTMSDVQTAITKVRAVLLHDFVS